MNFSETLRRVWGKKAKILSGAPLLSTPVSQACTASQFEEIPYAYWCQEFAETPRMHRKQWEFCYILQALTKAGLLGPGSNGLGFGVGGEPLAAVFAKRGVTVLATDLEPEQAQVEGWVDTDQHASSKAILNQRKLCGPKRFNSLVTFRHMDMNNIDPNLKDFDFCWSACALEHLGSIANGLTFIRKSLDCLKPGGIAVHTTELNCSSNTETLDNTSTVLFRKRDFLALGDELARAGHSIQFKFDLGDQPLDNFVDVPPYQIDDHLKLQIEDWVTTSFGIIIRKKGE